jgi:hypothetical protein
MKLTKKKLVPLTELKVSGIQFQEPPPPPVPRRITGITLEVRRMGNYAEKGFYLGRKESSEPIPRVVIDNSEHFVLIYESPK